MTGAWGSAARTRSSPSPTLRLPVGPCPRSVGRNPHLVATLAYEQLKAQLDALAGWPDAATGRVLLGGLPVIPTTARRLACDAGIIPAILGSHGEVLDLGRKQPV
jgi:hypothetical protein